MGPELVRQKHFDGVHCKLSMLQYAGGLVELRISGTDVSEFGDAPMRLLSEWLEELERIDLFIDAGETRGASIEVSAEWARWLAAKRGELREISMLTGSRFIEITADFVRRFRRAAGSDEDLHGSQRFPPGPRRGVRPPATTCWSAVVRTPMMSPTCSTIHRT